MVPEPSKCTVFFFHIFFFNVIDVAQSNIFATGLWVSLGRLLIRFLAEGGSELMRTYYSELCIFISGSNGYVKLTAKSVEAVVHNGLSKLSF